MKEELSGWGVGKTCSAWAAGGRWAAFVYLLCLPGSVAAAYLAGEACMLSFTGRDGQAPLLELALMKPVECFSAHNAGLIH